MKINLTNVYPTLAYWSQVVTVKTGLTVYL